MTDRSRAKTDSDFENLEESTSRRVIQKEGRFFSQKEKLMSLINWKDRAKIHD